ncbi:two pore domain potassium channel family protein [archaeon]|jgi:voltage-gated potassium channel|nr:two pore domain potassium channel family protein [Candidatus Woesearchaeota archaeon]MBT4135623.1 two pore domain potassium channel family protein [archaeon]MBT4241824.1 two pore domain potassium channel family protein [archaeon]MBT4418372.1 two pore domain potassium channel family protein [archaeon]
MKIERKVITLSILFLLVIFIGSYFYHMAEGWSYMDSIYFVVITITTIGYGDFVPITNFGKIFTIFFSFLGIAMAFYIISSINHFMIKKHVSKHVSALKHDIKEGEIKVERGKKVKRVKR